MGEKQGDSARERKCKERGRVSICEKVLQEISVAAAASLFTLREKFA